MAELTGLSDTLQLLRRFLSDAAAYIELHQEMFGNYKEGLMLQARALGAGNNLNLMIKSG